MSGQVSDVAVRILMSQITDPTFVFDRRAVDDAISDAVILLALGTPEDVLSHILDSPTDRNRAGAADA